MARVTDTVTGKPRRANTDTEQLVAQAAAVLKDAWPPKVASQGTLNFCATCSHSKDAEHPHGPCIARWTVGEEKHERICTCREFWPERKQREGVLGHWLERKNFRVPCGGAPVAG